MAINTGISKPITKQPGNEGHDWLVIKLIIRFWLSHNLQGLKRVRAYSQANLVPESSKNLLVAANIAIFTLSKP